MREKILFIDHYDSFSATIVYYFKELGAELRLIKSDEFARVQELDSFDFSALVLSPGPNSPIDYPFTSQCIHHFKGRKKILGICLGHQCINLAFGGKIEALQSPKHGKTTQIYHKNKGIFKDIQSPFKASLYHSLYVSDLAKECEILATDERGVIMALKHKKYQIYGLQFHPEAILSEFGKELLRNFLEL